MLKKSLLAIFAAAVLPLSLNARIAIDDHEVAGVKPSEKISVSTLEFNPSVTVIDDKAGTSISGMTAKYYQSFNNMFSLGVELPFKRFESPNNSANAIGDILLSASALKRFDNLAFGTTWELTVPTATKDVLGIGLWQISPSVFMQYEIVPQVFLAAGYKHYASFAGPSSREDINMGRIRGVVAFLSKHNWWILADPQLYIDYKNNNANEFILEIETGIMLYDEVSIYIKPGWHIAGNRNTMDWSLNFGVKLLDL